jgi:hypothetical protein
MFFGPVILARETEQFEKKRAPFDVCGIIADFGCENL